MTTNTSFQVYVQVKEMKVKDIRISPVDYKDYLGGLGYQPINKIVCNVDNIKFTSPEYLTLEQLRTIKQYLTGYHEGEVSMTTFINKLLK